MGYIDSFDFEGDYITWTTDGANAGTVFNRHGRFNCTNVCGTIKLHIDHPAFVAYILGRFAPAHVTRHLGNPKLMNDVMKRIVIPLPPTTAEQNAIAEALGDADVLIESLERLIAKKRDIKQGAMQELLTGRRRLPGFTGKWETKLLGDVALMTRLNVIPASWPSQMFVHFSLPAYDAGKEPVVEPGSAIGSNKFRVPQGAVLVSKLNPRIPRVWAPIDIPEDSIASTEFLVLTPRDGVSRLFLFIICASPRFCEQMELAATGTTGSHQRISPSGALNLNVFMPIDADEQTAIASILSDMDAEISALEAKLAKAQAIKQGMMQELLTGRIRLK